MLERHTGERIRFGADFNGNAAALLAEAKPGTSAISGECPLDRKPMRIAATRPPMDGTFWIGALIGERTRTAIARAVARRQPRCSAWSIVLMPTAHHGGVFTVSSLRATLGLGRSRSSPCLALGRGMLYSRPLLS